MNSWGIVEGPLYRCKQEGGCQSCSSLSSVMQRACDDEDPYDDIIKHGPENTDVSLWECDLEDQTLDPAQGYELYQLTGIEQYSSKLVQSNISFEVN